MGHKEIKTDIADRVATLTLDRPQALNALTFGMMDEVKDALDRIAGEGKARALVLTGAGRAFCAGQDLKDLTSSEAAGIERLAERHYLPVLERLRDYPMPVIGAINGVAAGGGFGLALACDILLAAESASFVMVFSRIGLVPDLGSTYVLPRFVGRARALAAMMTNEPIPARQAEEWGIVLRAIPDARFAEEVRAFAARLAAGPTRALAETRRLVDAAEHATYGEQIRRELEAQGGIAAGYDGREGVAAFVEKRAARFEGR